MLSFDRRYLNFFHLFNQEKFFEAHEVLESLWRETKTEERDFYQALIQIAAAFVHLQKNTPAGAGILYEKAAKLFSKYPEKFCGISISSVLKAVQRKINSGGPFPKIPFPQPA